MTTEKPSENIVLTVSAGVMALMALYALATDGLGLDRAGTRFLMHISLVIAGAATVVRFIRLRNWGVRVLVVDLPSIPPGERIKYLLWLLIAAIIGSYSLYEIVMGGFFFGTLACVASLASMFIVTRAIVRPPYS